MFYLTHLHIWCATVHTPCDILNQNISFVIFQKLKEKCQTIPTATFSQIRFKILVCSQHISKIVILYAADHLYASDMYGLDKGVLF